MRNSDDFILFEHPSSDDASLHVEDNLIKFDLSSNRMDSSSEGISNFKEESYSLRIESLSEIFQGDAYLKSRSSLEVISDGKPYEIDFSYSNPTGLSTNPDLFSSAQYFLYLPSSHKFELQLNAHLSSFESDKGSLLADAVKSDDAALDSRRVYDPEFMNFKIAFKLLELDSDVKTRDIRWAEEFTHDE